MKMLRVIDNLTINIIFLIFFLFFIIILSDYGVSQDEYALRTHGFVTLKYVGNLFFPDITNFYIGEKNIPDLNSEYQGKSYGAYYSALLGLIEIIFNIHDKYYQFLLRHYINFIIFFGSAIVFFKILHIITENKILSFTGFLFLILSPRIFANYFYNTIDIYFLSIIIFLNYFTVKILYVWNFKNLVIVSLFTALVVDHRIAGIYFLIQNIFFFILILRKNFNLKKIVNFILIYLILSSLFIYLFWPYLWSDPINNFITAFKEMSAWNYKVVSLFNGEEYISDNLPWFYLFLWIGITLPLLYLFFFLLGILSLNLKLKEFIFAKSKYLISYYYFYFTLLGTAFMVILINPNLYNGWRHFYYLYPSILIISIYGVQFFLKKNKIIKSATYFVIIINFLFVINWMINNHPHQQTYFNIFAGKNVSKNFDMDYWALSYKSQLIFMLNNEKKKKIKIYNLSESKVYYSLFSIKEKDRERFEIVNSLQDADFIITNYYFFDNNKKKLFKKIFRLNKLNDVRVDDNIISSVFVN